MLWFANIYSEDKPDATILVTFGPYPAQHEAENAAVHALDALDDWRYCYDSYPMPETK